MVPILISILIWYITFSFKLQREKLRLEKEICDLDSYTLIHSNPLVASANLYTEFNSKNLLIKKKYVMENKRLIITTILNLVLVLIVCLVYYFTNNEWYFLGLVFTLPFILAGVLAWYYNREEKKYDDPIWLEKSAKKFLSKRQKKGGF